MELAPRTAERFLAHAFDQLLGVAGRVPEPWLNARPHAETTNSIASLVVHCCGVVEYWLGHVALGEQSTRDREGEFSATAMLAELRELAAATTAGAAGYLDRLDTDSATDIARRSPLYGGDTSDAAIVLHVLEECFQHLGHAELAADALAAREGDR